MTVLYVLLPLALLAATCAVVAFCWMVRAGQYDDLDTPPVRMLFDIELSQHKDSNDDTALRTKRGV